MRNLPILMSGVLLGLFGILGAALVGVSYEGTAEQIAHNEREALLQQLEVLVPGKSIDNDILNDVVQISAPETVGAESTQVHLARLGDKPVAAVFSPVVMQGYSGPIRLIVAVRYDGTVSGVRVLSHRETPGLGDKIEIERTDWITGFDGKSLLDPAAEQWRVKRDGGVFDQFTGATVTPRAVVKGVRQTLAYFNEHKLQLFGLEQAAVEKSDE